MSTNIVTSYSDWQRVQEKQASAKQIATSAKVGKQKVIAKKTGEDTFKIKIIRDLDVLDANGKLTQIGWESLKSWIKLQPQLKDINAKLSQPDKFKVTYNIRKDKREGEKQVIEFTAVDASKYPNIKTQVIGAVDTQPVSQYILKKDDTTVEEKPVEASPEDATKTKEVKTEEADLAILKKENLPIKRGTKGDLIKQFQNMVMKKVEGTKLADTSIFKKFKGYGADGVYGPTTAVVTKVLKTGYGFEDKNGDTITHQLVTMLNTKGLNESYIWYNKLIEGFNMDIAVKVAGEYQSSDKTVNKPDKKEEPKKEEKPIKKIDSEETKKKAKLAASKIMALYKVKSESIKKLFEGDYFDSAKGRFDDDEEEAKRLFNNYWVKNISPVLKKINKVRNEEAFKKYADEETLKQIRRNAFKFSRLKEKIESSIVSKDKVKWSIYDVDGSYDTYKIDADV